MENVPRTILLVKCTCQGKLVVFSLYTTKNNLAYCGLRNEMGRNEMEMEICSLRNGNL